MPKQIIDSNTIEIPNEFLVKFAKNKFNESQNKYIDAGGRIVTSYHVQPEKMGLSNIYVGENSTKIDTSAKILNERYLDGINETTFDRFIDEINSTNLIKVNADDIWNNGIFHKLHVDNYIYLKNRQQVYDYINELELYATQKKYLVEPYNNSGIVAKGKSKSNSYRLIAYSKGRDIERRTKENRLLKSFMSEKDLEKADRQFRIETNLRTYKSIRYAYDMNKDVNRFYVGDILTSEAKPNLKIFSLMFDEENLPREKQSDIDYYKYLIGLGMKRSEIEKRIGMRNIARMYNFNIDLIASELGKTYSKNTNFSKVKRDYRNIIKELNSEEMKADFNLITDIKTRLVTN